MLARSRASRENFYLIFLIFRDRRQIFCNAIIVAHSVSLFAGSLRTNCCCLVHVVTVLVA